MTRQMKSGEQYAVEVNEAGYRQAFEAFMQEAEDAVMKSTTAGFGGSGYSVELFEDGAFRLLWDGQIGNLYVSSGMLMSIPQLDSEDLGDDVQGIAPYYDNALDELREKFELAIEGVIA